MAARNSEPDKDTRSLEICERLAALPEFQSSKTIQFYVDVRSEVRTRDFLPRALEMGKRVIVPYCVDEHLELFFLESMDELETGTFGILEPRKQLRGRPEKQFSVEDVDLIMVPGVVFDRRGGRMGHGRGFYDKLLAQARPDTCLIALAFECQLIDEVPMEPHDIYVNKVLTEKAVYQGRRGSPLRAA